VAADVAVASSAPAAGLAANVAVATSGPADVAVATSVPVGLAAEVGVATSGPADLDAAVGVSGSEMSAYKPQGNGDQAAADGPKPAEANVKLSPAAAMHRIQLSIQERTKQNKLETKIAAAKKRPAAAINKRSAAAIASDDLASETDQKAEPEIKRIKGQKPHADILQKMRTGTLEERIALYQKHGCTKCRWQNCTPSCWKMRKMTPGVDVD
jgi:hypothetical protein